MKQAEDKATRELPLKPRAMTNAERQKAYRQRLRLEASNVAAKNVSETSTAALLKHMHDCLVVLDTTTDQGRLAARRNMAARAMLEVATRYGIKLA